MSPKSLLLPQAIRQARRRRCWTQMELARRLEVSQSTISFWERGIETPSLAHQVQLVTLLPEILEQLALQEADLLIRLYRLERAINNGKCSCQACRCSG
jgi:transcriptional regulator with XRE-family HTH domain